MLFDRAGKKRYNSALGNKTTFYLEKQLKNCIKIKIKSQEYQRLSLIIDYEN